MKRGYVVIDGRYTRYSIMVEIPSHIKTRREAITFLDGYGTAVAAQTKQHYKYNMTEICFDTDTERAEMSDLTEFKVGDYIVYTNGDTFEIGRIKRLTDGGAFVCYHEGETAAKTPYDCMHKLINGYCIKESTLGGEIFK